MCQRNMSLNSRNNYNCEPNIGNEVLSKNELLVRLQEYLKNLEAELLIVKGKLGGADQEEGGEKRG